MKNISAVKYIMNQKLLKVFDSSFAQQPEWQYVKQSKYSSKDIFQRLIHVELENSSIEDICTDFEGCSPDVVHKRLKELDFEKTKDEFNSILLNLLDLFKIHGNQNITVLVDFTEQLYYGSENMILRKGTKHQKGTSYSIQYFTASILTATYIIPIFCLPLKTSEQKKPELVFKKLIDAVYQNVPFTRIIGDRYFFSAKVKELLDEYSIEFLFNLKEYSTIKGEIEDQIEYRKNLARENGIDCENDKTFYKWLKQEGLLNFSFTSYYDSHPDIEFEVKIKGLMVSKKQKNGNYVKILEFLSYVSNIPVTNDYLADLYKRRWGIETQYSTVHRFQGKTCSKNENVRIFIFILGFVLLCLWLFLNAILNRNLPVTMLYDNSELVVKISGHDKLVMTGKQFRRRMLKVLNTLEKDW